ncbi:MAG: type III-A CRISPR-associated protein Csm2 [candidate division WOR-3 bacterium]
MNQGPQKTQEGEAKALLKKMVENSGQLKELYNNAETLKDLLKRIDKFAEELKGSGVKTTQIRKFYDKLRSLELKLEKSKLSSQKKEELNEQVRIGVLSLKPLLAYAVGRNDKLKGLVEVLNVAIDKVRDYDDFKKFVEFFQTIVAYHKYHGGD